jgi:hypothetical protein
VIDLDLTYLSRTHPLTVLYLSSHALIYCDGLEVTFRTAHHYICPTTPSTGSPTAVSPSLE